MQAIKTKLQPIVPLKQRLAKPAKRLAEKRADNFAQSAIKALNRIRGSGERPKVW